MVCIIEMWLWRYILDLVVNIIGYNLIWLDRKEVIYGGVCFYVKDYILFFILEDFGDDNNNFLEVLWVKLWLFWFLRGFFNIIVGFIYYLLMVNNLIMLEYLINCLLILEVNYVSSGVIFFGDLN